MRFKWKSKKEAGNEMCDRKYMFGSCQNGQNMPKKGQKDKIFFCSLNKDQLPTLLM